MESRALYSTSEISSVLATSKGEREIGEKEVMVERENPHRSRGMKTGKDFIFSEKAYLSSKLCRTADCTKGDLLATGDRKGIKRQLSKVSN